MSYDVSSVMQDVLQLDRMTIFAKWLTTARYEEQKIELSGLPLERPMSSSGRGQPGDDDDDDDDDNAL